MGGHFTLSDDSHGVEQVGLNYKRVLDAIHKAGITEIMCIAPKADADVSEAEPRSPSVSWTSISVTELQAHGFWKN